MHTAGAQVCARLSPFGIDFQTADNTSFPCLLGDIYHSWRSARATLCKPVPLLEKLGLSPLLDPLAELSLLKAKPLFFK